MTIRGEYTIEELRQIYRLMINRLKTCIENGPDKNNMAHLEAFLSQLENNDDGNELEELFLLCLSRMRCSVDGVRFTLRGMLIDLALEGLENQDANNQRWIECADLYGT